MSLLEVTGLSAGYGDVRVVYGVDMTVAPGQLVGIVGPNGAGKSTLLGALAGSVRSTDGSIRFAGREIRGRKPEENVRSGLALVPEGRHIFAGMTVEENLRLGLTGRRTRGGAGRALQEVTDLFPVLRSHQHQRAGLLSGGQQQQLAIARALVAEPLLLMLDEPSLGLSPLVVRGVFDVLARIQELGTAVVVVEQRAHLLIGLADRTLVLREGAVQACLTPADEGDEALLTNAYFGRETV